MIANGKVKISRLRCTVWLKDTENQEFPKCKKSEQQVFKPADGALV